MTALPDIAWTFDPGLLHAVAAFGAFLFGTASHEFMHVAVLKALREPYEVDILPHGLAAAIFSAALVDVQMKRMAERWRVALVMLAPVVAATPPLAAWAVAFMYPVVEIGTLAVLFVWFAFALPSPHDIATVAFYDPSESVPAEVDSA